MIVGYPKTFLLNKNKLKINRVGIAESPITSRLTLR